MSKHKDYWRNLDPAKKDARLNAMRKYANARYERMKANGQIRLKGRPRSAYGARNKAGFIQDYIDAQKVAIGECFDCGLPCEDWSVIMFAFDHLDPSQKYKSVTDLQFNAYSIKTIKEEVRKCVPICRNCHMEYHYLERQKLIRTFKEYLKLDI